MFEYNVLVSVVKQGLASKILKTLKKSNVTGGTIVYGKGTADSEILKFFEYDKVKKEILFSVIDKNRETEILDILNKTYNFEKENTGIAFTMPLVEVITNKSRSVRNGEEENINMKYEVIFVVVDNHLGEDVVKIANKYGATGATIIHGRGSGVHEKGSIFNITIEPEKEIVMMLVSKESHAEILDGLSDELKIDEPGNGIIFSANVNNAIGLVK